MTVSRRRQRRRSRTATVLLLSSTLMVTSLSAQAWAIPGPGMNRAEETGQVDLPPLPEGTTLPLDESAEKDLTTSPEKPVEVYEPTAVTPWQESSGTATLTAETEDGTSVPVTNDLPIAVGVPLEADATALAGDWTVDLTAPETSQEVGVSGLIMKVTPPPSVDPEAEVTLTVDTTAFADLYGPQAASRFGLVLLPDCVVDSPDTGDCATDDGTTTMAGQSDPQSFERLSSSVTVVPAKDAPTRSRVAKNPPTRDVLTGTVPVAKLLGGSAESAVTGASTRTAAVQAASATGRRVVGALDTGSSVQGDFTASPLLSAGSWSAGASSGAF
ncbi:sugar-binding protein, partial [Streptomyces sp. NPDC048577]